MENLLKKGSVVYYARALRNVNLYEIVEIKIRTITDSYFAGIEDKTKHAFIFDIEDLNRIVFLDRKDALRMVKEEEKNKKEISDEKYYEEY